MRRALAFLAVLAVTAMVLPGATANHPETKDFTTHYTVKGRVVNETGWPLEGIQVTARLISQTAGTVTNCGGDFTIEVPATRTLSEFEDIEVRASGTNVKTLKADPYLRRSDATFVLPGSSYASCRTSNIWEAWEYRYTIEGRIVDRVDPYEKDGVRLFSQPINGTVARMTFVATVVDENGDGVIWTLRDSGAANIITDPSGNFLYSYVMAEEKDGGFKITADTWTSLNVTIKNQTYDVLNPDFTTRYSFLGIVRGDAPSGNDTPAAAAPLVALAAAAAALLASRRRWA